MSLYKNFCVNCKYCEQHPDAKLEWQKHICSYTSAISLVTGLPYKSFVSCESMRSDEDLCGRPGRYFKDKNETSN